MSASRRTADRVAAVAGAITTAGMIATPLLPQRGRARAILSSVVVTGLFATTTANAARRWGPYRAATAATTTSVATAAIERFGTATGFPFGRYAYSRTLRPQIGHVPAIVPMAWFAMALPAREAAHAALGEQSTRVGRVLLGSAAMTAWDLFLDPQMVGEGYWAWARRGVYRGIPLTNFIGWFLTGLGVMLALEAMLPPGDEPASGTAPGSVGGADGRLVATYSFMAVMETLGFARFFRDPVVAVVGGAAMLPVAGAALARTLTSTPPS
jgi:putative membrane protein